MRIAIIGSGASGLVAIKECIEYGQEPVCFEKSSDIGGLWRYRPEPEDGQPSIMKSTIINSSKEMMAFSDFAPDENLPFYMHNSGILSYLRAYADHFKLLHHIRFDTEVVKVSQTDNYEKTGRWEILSKSAKGEATKETFDAVMLCTGHHVYPYTPEFKGISNFKGKVIHSRAYKEPHGYEDKRVLIVGMGNTGGDLAVELGRIASQVYVVSRSGNWLTSRLGREGYPFDMIFNTYAANRVFRRFPKLSDMIMERLANISIDHEFYGLQPSHRWSQQHLFINDDLSNRLASGTVKIIRSGICEFKPHNVNFENGESVENIDVVIFATGYSIAFPFLDSTVLPVAENETNLYKFMFPTNLQHPTLSCIGLIQPFGPVFPIVELQSRVVLSVLTRYIKLPSTQEMLKDVEATRQRIKQRFVNSRRHTIQVDYGLYMDELAAMISVRPQYWKRIFTDPELAFKTGLGPVLSYNYRLDGIHAKPDLARELLCTVWERTLYPVSHSKEKVRKRYLKPSLIEWFVLYGVGAVGLVVIFLWIIREIVF